MWPNFFIVGAAKAGTTSLYQYLKQIPGIYMSPVKEPHYFSRRVIPDDHHYRPIRDKEKYLNLFKKVNNEKVVGEASPTYLRDPEAPKLIHQVSPNARILISLRDPIERTFSLYLSMLRNRFLKLSFHEEVLRSLKHRVNEYSVPNLRLHSALYSKYVKNYLDIFGKKQVKIIIFEEFIKDSKSTVQEILEFLDVNYTINDFKVKVHNPYRVWRGPVVGHIAKNTTAVKISKAILPQSTLQFLTENIFSKKQPKSKMDQQAMMRLVRFYSDDVEILEKILGRKLPWANFKNDS